MMVEKDDTKELIKMSISVTVNNTVRIMGFIILAIVFKRWWLVFLAVFFLSYAKEK